MADGEAKTQPITLKFTMKTDIDLLYSADFYSADSFLASNVDMDIERREWTWPGL